VTARRPARRRLPPRRTRQTATTTAKGYGAAHQAKRRQAAKVVASGNAICWGCSRLIHPAEPWDLGHDDHRLAKHLGLYRGPEHRRCSRSAGGWRRWGYTTPPPTPPRRTGPRPNALRFFDPEPVSNTDGET
jgi:hypothetical protein